MAALLNGCAFGVTNVKVGHSPLEPVAHPLTTTAAAATQPSAGARMSLACGDSQEKCAVGLCSNKSVLGFLSIKECQGCVPGAIP